MSLSFICTICKSEPALGINTLLLSGSACVFGISLVQDMAHSSKLLCDLQADVWRSQAKQARDHLQAQDAAEMCIMLTLTSPRTQSASISR